jgi:hypothetical protein
LFDGYILLALALPENGDGQWPVAVAENIYPPQRLPLFTFIPVSQGVINQQTKVLYNDAINPPNSRYVAYWYDRNKRRVFPATGVSPSFFTISAGTYAISLPTLTVPTNTATVPTPEGTGV